MELPDYLYIYRDSNTVIQLYKDENKTYILSDGMWEDEVDFSLPENEHRIKGIENPHWKCRDAVFKSGDRWDVYANPCDAFGV